MSLNNVVRHIPETEKELHQKVKLPLLDKNCVDFWIKIKSKQIVKPKITDIIYQFYGTYVAIFFTFNN